MAKYGFATAKIIYLTFSFLSLFFACNACRLIMKFIDFCIKIYDKLISSNLKKVAI